jgi:hypothetical protein
MQLQLQLNHRHNHLQTSCLLPLPEFCCQLHASLKVDGRCSTAYTCVHAVPLAPKSVPWTWATTHYRSSDAGNTHSGQCAACHIAYFRMPGASWGVFFSAYNRARARYQRRTGSAQLSPAVNLAAAAEAGALVSGKPANRARPCFAACPFDGSCSCCRDAALQHTGQQRICSCCPVCSIRSGLQPTADRSILSVCAHFNETAPWQSLSPGYVNSNRRTDACCTAAGVLCDQPHLGGEDAPGAAAGRAVGVGGSCDSSPGGRCLCWSQRAPH